MQQELAQASQLSCFTAHDEAGSLVGVILANLRPVVQYLRWPSLDPRIARAAPFGYVPLPYISRYVAGITDRRPSHDPSSEYLASGLAQALGIVAVQEGFSATVVPGRPPDPSAPDQPTDKLHRLTHERLGLKEIIVGHFAVRAADGRIDNNLLLQESTLYADTNFPGQGGLNELRHGPVDFRDVIAKYS
ncbi:MAG: hypothetical protein ACREBW_10030 [Candidatus Micrarchaeaceae archaeon]